MLFFFGCWDLVTQTTCQNWQLKRRWDATSWILWAFHLISNYCRYLSFLYSLFLTHLSWYGFWNYVIRIMRVDGEIAAQRGPSNPEENSITWPRCSWGKKSEQSGWHEVVQWSGMVRNLQRSSSKEQGKHKLLVKGNHGEYNITESKITWKKQVWGKASLQQQKIRIKTDLQKCSYNQVVDWAAQRNCCCQGKFCQTFSGQERQHFRLPGSLLSEAVELCRSGHKQMASWPLQTEHLLPMTAKLLTLLWLGCATGWISIHRIVLLLLCYPSQCTLILVPHLITFFMVAEILAASSSCCSQLTFLSFSFWLFFQLWKSV